MWPCLLPPNRLRPTVQCRAAEWMTGWRELVDGDLPGRYVDSRDANSNSYWKMSSYVRVHVRAPSQRHTVPRRRRPPLYCSAPGLPLLSTLHDISFNFGAKVTGTHRRSSTFARNKVSVHAHVTDRIEHHIIRLTIIFITGYSLRFSLVAERMLNKLFTNFHVI